MKAGPVLNRKLVLERPVRNPDGAGGHTRSWTPLGSLWAEVKSRTGGEVLVGAVEAGVVRVRITVRAAPFGSPSRPQADQRFRDGARIYTIQAVTEADRDGKFLTCFAEEGFAT